MTDESNEIIDETSGPATLEDAFRSLRESDSKTTSAAVGDGNLGEVGDGSKRAEEAAPESGSQGNEGVFDSVSGEEPGEGYDNAGGFTDTIEEPEESDYDEVDYGEVSKAYIQSTQRLAIDAANKLFRDNGVTKASINDLYEKDDRGRVSFRNPDDPDRPFQSRAEAQQWCEAFNAQVDMEWRNTVKNYQNGYMRDIQPMLRLMNFAPEFKAMSGQEQKVFDSIVENYEVKDKEGMVIGYSCDLDSAKNIAMNICKNFEQRSEAQESSEDMTQNIPGGGPALDAKTSGTNNPQNDTKTPKTLEEAMKIVSEQKRKDRKNG